MLLKSIELENIRSYENEKITFPSGSVLLSGDIGSGKSTILLAIDFALFGIRRGEVEGTDVLRHGKDKGYVELNVEINDKDVVIKRTLKRSKSVTQENGTITINGVSQELMPSEMSVKIQEMLGYSKEATKKNLPVFRYTVYTPQEEMKAILTSKDRIEVLRKIFGIDKYGIIRNNARTLLTELRSMKKVSEAKSSDFETRLTELETLKQNIVKFNEALIKESNILNETNTKLEYKKNEIMELEKDIENSQKLERNKVSLESQLNVYDIRIMKLLRELNDTETKISRYLEDMKTLDVEGDVNDLRKMLTELKRKKFEVSSKIGSTSKEMEKFQDILNKGVCGFCGQLVHNREEFKKNIDDKVGELQRIEMLLAEFEESENNVNDTLIKLEKKQHVRDSLNDFYTIQKRLIKERDDLEKMISDSKITIENLTKELVNFEEKKIMYREIQKLIEGIRNDMLVLEKNVSKLEADKINSENTLKIIERDLEEKKKEREKSQRIGELVTWIDDNFVNLMENIEKHVMHSIHNEFEKFFQEWFDMLMGEQLSVRIDEQFTPIIEQNGYETEYNNLSGGEKTSVALAYRLALNKVVNILIEDIRTKDMLILDEPTDGFSTDQLERMRDVLNNLGLRQTIIVSHEPKIDTFVENIIRVYKDGHISKIVK